MPKYERVCDTCGRHQVLVGMVRSPTCRDCQLRYKKPRLGTGKDWYLHTRTGYMVKCIDGFNWLQHRWIMEQHIGRPLTTEEHVHHKDHNRLNNSIENLEIISATEHGRIHMTERNQQGLHIYAANVRWGNV